MTDNPTIQQVGEDALANMSEEELAALNLEVLAERKRAGEALNELMDRAQRGQALKLNMLKTRALAGFVWQLTQQNTHMGNLLDTAADALEVDEKKEKRKLWKPRLD